MEKKTFKAYFHRLFPVRLLVPWIFLWKGARARLTTAHGWARSLRHLEPVDEHGRPMPWLPYAVVRFLAERVRPDLSVLELGAGYSTLWFASAARRVVSVEHDAKWIAWLRERLDGGAGVEVVATSRDSADAYLAPVRGRGELFDLVLVDGPFRNEAFREALGMLTPAGVIVLDDSDRPAYAPSFAEAARAGLRRLDFEGHKAATVNVYRTTVFYRDGNCLGI